MALTPGHLSGHFPLECPKCVLAARLKDGLDGPVLIHDDIVSVNESPAKFARDEPPNRGLAVSP